MCVVFVPGQHKDATIKLKGIDVPKLTGFCPQERALARKARAFGENILQKILLTELLETEEKGVFMVQVMTPSGKDPVDQLISQELARPYWGGHIFGWCKDQTTGLL